MENFVVRKKKLSKRQVGIAEKTYLHQLHILIDAIYDHAANVKKWTWQELAEKSDLSYLTVKLLGERKTKLPRYCTVYKLAKSISWELVLTTEKSKRMVG